MTGPISELAERCGIECSYVSETGEHRIVPEEVKRALLAAMEVSEEPAPPDSQPASEPTPCYRPDWLEHSRAWGVSVQLYGVRSARNLGIGDFEDLARLAEMFAGLGADFIGVNPLHALFPADPERASPYSPSHRRFLNPIYIAVDLVERVALSDEHRQRAAALAAKDIVDYAGVAALKREMLEDAFAARGDDDAFDAWCRDEGEQLDRFATFEALSEHFADTGLGLGLGVGWPGWPEHARDPASPEVAEYTKTHARRIRFRKWLQWVAARQLADAQERARRAGMRIGVYLDLAVGVAPDGAATWADRALFAARARIGAPPDLFNHAGQDWGLAPMKPANLLTRSFEPFARELAAAMRSAGAVRLDHVMSLSRLYWVPEQADARSGGYVRYPLEPLLSVLGRCSQAARCIVIGEDLGTVPDGFRDVMAGHGLLGYRVLYFEREHDGRFLAPDRYPAEAMACIATHDLPTLAGWWEGRDIEARAGCHAYENDGAAEAARRERAEARWKLVGALGDLGVLDGEVTGNAAELPDEVFVAAHRYLARTPSRLCVVQLEDLAGAREMVNLPGTDTQHPNWRRKLPLTVEELPERELLRRAIEAVAGERPRG